MATIVLLAPSGCSLGADDEPKRASGEAAADRRHGRPAGARGGHEKTSTTICDQLFTATGAEARRRRECARQLASAAQGVRRPSIEIEGIDVNKNQAAVEVRTHAKGQASVTDELSCAAQGRRWLVEALG